MFRSMCKCTNDQINDDYFEDLNEEKLEKIIDQINKNQNLNLDRIEED